MDRRTDEIAMAYTRYSIYAVARKKRSTLTPKIYENTPRLNKNAKKKKRN